jgi:hypothetical protein
LQGRPCVRFGFPARVPLSNGLRDRTEIDMRIGDVLFEAKLTEGDFQRATPAKLLRYRDFLEVFDCDRLPRRGGYVRSYQLIRNVLSAYEHRSSFCALLDARRPDLVEQFFAIAQCIRAAELRTRCGVLTWQELARVLPRKLQIFLAEKYGIE